MQVTSKDPNGNGVTDFSKSNFKGQLVGFKNEDLLWKPVYHILVQIVQLRMMAAKQDYPPENTIRRALST